MRYFNLIITLYISYTVIQADGIPFTSEGDIKFYLDCAGFNGKNGETLQEFYISSFSDQFDYQRLDSNLKADLMLSTRITDNFGRSYHSDSWNMNLLVPADKEISKELVIYDQWSVSLLPGEYKLWVELEDVNSEKIGEMNERILIRKFENNKLLISDVEFVSNYNKKDRIQFKKGNIFIKPNPWRRYGVLNPILYFYFELYNTSFITSDSITINYSIVNDKNNKLRELSVPKANRDNYATVLNGIEVSNIPSGIYSLIIEINDQMEELIQRSEKFEIIQPDYIELASNSSKIFEMFDDVSEYILTVEELDRYESVTPPNKISFIEDFLKSKDPTLSTEENEYLRSLYNRYNYAMQNYSWGKIRGIDTDRGRIVVVYGLPDELNRYAMEEESSPYEIWKYYQDRQFEFVFCDLRSDGRYTLLHSTKEGEIYNPNWFSEVKK